MTTPRISVVLPVLAPTPFLREMTEFAIKTLREHADNPFELIVVEAEHDYFDPRDSIIDQSDRSRRIKVEHAPHPDDNPLLKIDKYLHFNPKIGGVKELNAGVDAATGEFVVSTGNDVIVPPHWDTELLRCFDERWDCGIASLSALEPGAVIGPPHTMDRIVEGMYSPFMMFRSQRQRHVEDRSRGQGPVPYRFDESYVKIYQDSDFILKMYEAGYRAYRSCRAHVHHLLRMTSDRVEPEKHARDLARDERLFYTRWGKSPLMMFGMIRYGHMVFGREWESFEQPINLHYDPNKVV